MSWFNSRFFCKVGKILIRFIVTRMERIVPEWEIVGKKIVGKKRSAERSLPLERDRRSLAAEKWVPFAFPAVKGVPPHIYLPIFQLSILGLLFFFFFLFPGLRNPQVRLRVRSLPGPAVLYLDGKLLGNLPRDYWVAPGTHKIRVEKSGFVPFEKTVELPRKIWNNLWAPPLAEWDARLEADPAERESFLWEEAWRLYLYRGLEGQRTLPFDSSYVYPARLQSSISAYLGWVASDLPSSWSVDLQKGLASTTSGYQALDLLRTSMLLFQYQSVEKPALREKGGIRLPLLGPRALLVGLRNITARLFRLEPNRSVLSRLTPRPLMKYTDFWDDWEERPVEGPGEQVSWDGPERLTLNQSQFLPVYRDSGNREIAFLLQQTEVLNREFQRFFASERGIRLRAESERVREEAGAAAENLIYEFEAADQRLPWGWSGAGYASGEGDLPVRGISWSFALAYCQWLEESVPEALRGKYQVRLPTRGEWEWLVSFSEGKTAGRSASTGLLPADRLIPDELGFQALSGNVWEWLQDDYLPYRMDFPGGSAERGVNLWFKAVAGGAWLNAETENEISLSERGYEVPVPADSSVIGGLPALIRNPYVGFRPVIVRSVGD